MVRTGDAAGARRPRCATGSGGRRSPRCSAAPTPRSAPPLLGAGDVAGAAALRWPLARREGLGRVRAAWASAPSHCARAAGTTPRKAFTEARDAGTPDVAAAADYGLAVAAFHKGARQRVRQARQAALAALPPGPRSADRAGELLYVAHRRSRVESKDWPGALGTARRLVDRLSRPTRRPTTRSSASAAGAAAAKAWPVALEADTLLRQRYPQSPFIDGGRVRVAEALLETGKADEARREIEQVAADDAERQRGPTLLLARVREAGRRPQRRARGVRARRARGPAPEWSGRRAARPRAPARRRRSAGDQARGVLERLLKSEDNAVVAEAAARASATRTPARATSSRPPSTT